MIKNEYRVCANVLSKKTQRLSNRMVLFLCFKYLSTVVGQEAAAKRGRRKQFRIYSTSFWVEFPEARGQLG